MRATLERYQVWAYLLAVSLGLGFGWTSATSAMSEHLIWALLGMLLYATFTQTPLINLSRVFRDRRFMAALLTGNFLVMPAFTALMVLALPDNAALRLGVLLVLLMPCTDWFVTFTHLGKGDGSRAIAATPVLLVAQLAMLPLYLWLFFDEDLNLTMELARHLLPAFFGLILVPLVLALLTERLARRLEGVRHFIGLTGLLPVPLLTIVLFLVAAAHAHQLETTGKIFWMLLILFPVYLVAAALAGKVLSRIFRLPPKTGRTVIFSLGTRNSFVVLPLALALPEIWSTAILVIVVQSLVELFGMMVFIKWVPARLIPLRCNNNDH